MFEQWRLFENAAFSYNSGQINGDFQNADSRQMDLMSISPITYWLVSQLSVVSSIYKITA